MELFAILFTGPAAFIACAIYVSLLIWAQSKWPSIRLYLLVPSSVVIVLYAVEVILIAALDVQGTQALLGPGFYPVHFMLFGLSTPALVMVLTLWGRGSWFGSPLLVVPLGAVFAVFAVLLQHMVVEALFGIR